MAVGSASLIATLAACRAQAPSTPPPSPAPAVDKAVSELQSKSARFAPTDLTADITALPANEREALAHMVRAAQVMDALFLEQVWAGNESMLHTLIKDESPLGKARLHEFLINKGPWARLDHNAIFIPGAPEKLPSANFYPEGATKAEVEKWINSLGGAEKAKATGFFTTIRRGPDGRFIAVPYSTEYQGELAIAAQHLRAAAAATAQPTLKAFLESRAAAFSSNDYYDSDVKWMELDATIEPTIGPYEVYEDEWFNYKAAFEAFITVKDRTESDKLQRFAGSLQEIENNLPIDPKYRNPKLGALAPIAVVNTVFSAGDGNRGVQTAAFNLPNDERVIREKGSKRIMLKNNQQAKFDKVLVPISKVALSPADQGNVAFDAFFTHILMHELMHGLGPHDISVAGRTTTVRQELKDTYSTIEEAKADISGLFALQFLVDKGQLDKALREDDVHHVPGIGVSIAALRRQRSARPRPGDSAQLPAGQGRVQGQRRRHVQRRHREDSRRRQRADPRDHDAAGGRQLREGQADDRHARRASSRGQGGARQADVGAGRHRAEVRDRYRPIEVTNNDYQIAFVFQRKCL